jgi:hypothetical protein
MTKFAANKLPLQYSEETRKEAQLCINNSASEHRNLVTTHLRTNHASFPSFQSELVSPLIDGHPSNAHAEAKYTMPNVENPRSMPGDCNVKDYILAHVTPYDGDSSFLAPPTARTLKTWKRCEELIELERQRGILDVDTKTASTITSHGPGYVLSKEEDIIVGLQTEEPLKRACKPRGGFHVVSSALKSYGYQPDPEMAKTYTKVCNNGDDVVIIKAMMLASMKKNHLRP